jgi:hypothetical protein
MYILLPALKSCLPKCSKSTNQFFEIIQLQFLRLDLKRLLGFIASPILLTDSFNTPPLGEAVLAFWKFIIKFSVCVWDRMGKQTTNNYRVSLVNSCQAK